VANATPATLATNPLDPSRGSSSTTTTTKREFTVADEYRYNRKGPLRWIVSHVLRYKRWLATFILGTLGTQILAALVPVLTGVAFNEVLHPTPDAAFLLIIFAAILAIVVAQGVLGPLGVFGSEFLAQRIERDARDELYLNLLGKSQTFHSRQQIGDIMARATNDVRQLNAMMNPGVDLILDSGLSLVVPVIFIGVLNPQLLLAPLVFTVVLCIAIAGYVRRLSPVTDAMRAQFGAMNAGLAETITGIEVVKSTVQEAQEQDKFAKSAGRYRDLFVRNGQIQARYLPLLFYSFALAGAFLQGLLLVSQGALSVGGLISFLGLMALLRYPTFMSIFTFSLVQLGIAGAKRLLAIMREETELDENEHGYRGAMRGEIVFEHVTFGYGAPGETPMLKNVSFRAAPGQTVAIVGQTGAGKSTLTKLVNRTYDATSGRVLVDGVDVRDWSLDALRSQISTIEQDVFLFSRSIAENIGFSLGYNHNAHGTQGQQLIDMPAIQIAARDAQAHEFILSFKDGYETVVGERGVTLSGGQRQRLAIARALLTDPRILVLDDSTSAVDSATEDEIQKAIRRVLQRRTTLLITHRLSQIRWADTILVLKDGALVDQGTHADLLARCDLYRRIFARYDGEQSDAHSGGVPAGMETSEAASADA
jgi:ATP-binding cassette subfamily B protein